MSTYLIPCLIAFILVYGLFHCSSIFGCFLNGVNKGLQTVLKILPSAVAMLTAINMLRASGLLDILISVLSPIAKFAGIPSECVALILLKPISGGGALAIGADIIKQFGVDSIPGKTAAIMLASSDTTFFVTSMYLGSLKLKTSGYAIFCSLLSNISAFIFGALAVRFLG